VTGASPPTDGGGAGGDVAAVARAPDAAYERRATGRRRIAGAIGPGHGLLAVLLQAGPAPGVHWGRVVVLPGRKDAGADHALLFAEAGCRLVRVMLEGSGVCGMAGRGGEGTD